ncbi:MAG: hypothetical protein HXX17_02230 [Geobacteraceae bacterium]|nr:hypothetical protein [Geobacteraceae bacterium]
MERPQLLTFGSKILHTVLVLSGICCLLVFLLKPINDPDFFWHLKSGEWIIQHHAIPQVDPFGINPPDASDPRQKLILTSYWLYQALIAQVFSLCGFSGIILIRFLLAGIVTFTIWRTFRPFNILNSAICILSALLFLKEYTLDRPQTLSFVLYLLMLLLLFRFIDNRSCNRPTLRYAAGMATVMLVWSNMHGGYLVGQVIVVLVCITEGARFLHQSLRPMDRSSYLRLIGIALAALVGSYANPNFVNIIRQVDSVFALNSLSSNINTEYISVFRKWQETGSTVILLYYFIAAAALIVAVHSYRRTDITRLAILFCTGYFGFAHIRYFPFFLIAAVIFIMPTETTESGAKFIRAVVVIGAAASLFLCFPYGPVIPEKNNGSRWVTNEIFPVAAVDFLKARKARGAIFSHYRWGGYLIWRVAPELKPFIDSRSLDFIRFFDYSYCEEIVEGSNAADQKCSRIFQEYGINYLLINIHEPSGEAHPLLYSIGENPDWKLIYKEDNLALFQKND